MFMTMFFSVACSVRNGTRLSARVAGMTVYANRTSHACVKKANHGAWARAQHSLLEPQQQLVPTASPARAYPLTSAGPPRRAAAEEAHTEEAHAEEDEGQVFGSLSASLSSRRSYKKSSPDIEDLRYPEDEERADAQGMVQRRKRVNTPYWYFLQCRKLIKENKLQDALDLFSGDMLQGERLQPEEFNYSVLIGGCGRAGQLKKAFKLYNDLKKRGLKASDATYTALFNACAECPSKAAGLNYALKLEQELHRKNYCLSTITYHALMKAHAVTNHLQACLHTFREMLKNGHVATPETFHYLLMGCKKDKENGFRLALQIWRQMVTSGLLPDSKNYTLLLRVARDCGIGDPALASAVLLGPVEEHSRKTKKRAQLSGSMVDIDVLEKQLFIQSDTQSFKPSTRQDAALIQISDHNIDLPPAITEQNPNGPNLLDVFEGKGAGVVSLCAVKDTSDHLALIGGVQGFLQNMESKGLKPDVKTLTLLADMAESSQLCLDMLLKVAKQHHLKLDVGFFNCVIRRAAKTKDVETIQAVLSVMRQRRVGLNVQTFGCLALGCEMKKDALQLLSSMEEVGFRPNIYVFSALIGYAARRLDYNYLKTLLILMKEKEVWPNEVVIKQLEFAAQYPPDYDQYKSRNNYLVQIDGFRGYYKQWLQSVPAQTAEQTAEQAAEQTQIVFLTRNEKEDELTEPQRRPIAAPKRYHSKRGKGATKSAV